MVCTVNFGNSLSIHKHVCACPFLLLSLSTDLPTMYEPTYNLHALVVSHKIISVVCGSTCLNSYSVRTICTLTYPLTYCTFPPIRFPILLHNLLQIHPPLWLYTYLSACWPLYESINSSLSLSFTYLPS
jgi:hypothetical protein